MAEATCDGSRRRIELCRSNPIDMSWYRTCLISGATWKIEENKTGFVSGRAPRSFTIYIDRYWISRAKASRHRLT